MNEIQITPELKISELLDNFPGIENKLIELAPTFEKLKNPVLRDTLAKVTSLRQVSNIANISLSDLINNLREEAGQNEIVVEQKNGDKNPRPEWLMDENVKISYDARMDLEQGHHPAAKVTKEILTLEEKEIYLLITPFLPGPLIQIVLDLGFITYSTSISNDEVHTFIKKS